MPAARARACPRVACTPPPPPPPTPPGATSAAAVAARLVPPGCDIFLDAAAFLDAAEQAQARAFLDAAERRVPARLVRFVGARLAEQRTAPVPVARARGRGAGAAACERATSAKTHPNPYKSTHAQA
jgi:hypothetical protein